MHQSCPQRNSTELYSKKKNRWALFSIFVYLITACSGGGSSEGGGNVTGNSNVNPAITPETGSSASDMSLLELQALYSNLASDFYNGLRSPATLNPQSVEDFMRVLFFDQTLPRSTMAGTQVPADIAAKSVFSSFKAASSIEMPAHVGNTTFSKVEVNNTEVCENGVGTLQVSGSLNDDGTGGADIRFVNCLLAGLSVTGEGAIYFSPLGDYLFFNGATFQSVSGEQIVTGSLIERDAATTESNLVYFDPAFNEYGWLRNVSSEASGGFVERIDGEVIHSLHGAVNVTTFSPFREGSSGLVFTDGSLELTSTNGSVAKFESSQYGVKVFFKSESENEFSSGMVVPGGDINQLASLPVVQASQVDFPPVLDRLSVDIGFSDDVFAEDATIASFSDSFSDPEGGPLTRTFRWLVNGVPVDEGELSSPFSSAFPAGIAISGDTLTIEVELDDGVNTVNGSASVVVPDAPGSLDRSTIPQLFEGSNTSTFSLLVDDIDLGVGQSVPELISAPAGFTFDSDGLAAWDLSAIEPLSIAVEYSANFRIAGRRVEQTVWLTTYNASSDALQVHKPFNIPGDVDNRLATIKPSDSNGKSAILFNPDRNAIHFIEVSGEKLESKVYPYEIQGDLRFNPRAQFEESSFYYDQSDSGGFGEMYLATGEEILLLKSRHAPLTSLWKPVQGDPSQLNLFIYGAFGDFDGDSELDYAYLSGDRGLQSVDLESGTESSIPNSFQGFQIFAVGNFDSDVQDEIVTLDSSDGDGSSVYIIDLLDGGTTLVDDNIRTFGFSAQSMDVDNDQIDELLIAYENMDDHRIIDPLEDGSLPDQDENVFLEFDTASFFCDRSVQVSQIDFDEAQEPLFFCLPSTLRPGAVGQVVGFDADVSPPFLAFDSDIAPALWAGVADVFSDSRDEVIAITLEGAQVIDLATNTVVATNSRQSIDSFYNPILAFEGEHASARFLAEGSNLFFADINDNGATEFVEGISNGLPSFDTTAYLLDVNMDGDFELLTIDDDISVFEQDEIFSQPSALTAARKALSEHRAHELINFSGSDSKDFIYRSSAGVVGYDLDSKTQVWEIDDPNIFDFTVFSTAEGVPNLLANNGAELSIYSGLDTTPVRSKSLELQCNVIQSAPQGFSGEVKHICIGPFLFWSLNDSHLADMYPRWSRRIVALDENINVVHEMIFTLQEGDILSDSVAVFAEYSPGNNYVILSDSSRLYFLNLETFDLEFRTLPLLGEIEHNQVVYGKNPNTGMGYVAVGTKEASSSDGAMYLFPFGSE